VPLNVVHYNNNLNRDTRRLDPSYRVFSLPGSQARVPAAAAAAALASAPSATAPSEPTKGRPAAGYFCRLDIDIVSYSAARPLPSRLASSTHPAVSRAIVLPLPRLSHGTARPDCCCVFAAPHLHCVSWPHPNTGRSQRPPVRPIAVVAYLIRPNTLGA
jgi:hypothetical protein